MRPADLPLDETDALLAGLKPWIECESPTFDPAAVNRMMDLAAADTAAAGATITDQPHDRPWGIYSGYFRDLDGHLWEIIWNPNGPAL